MFYTITSINVSGTQKNILLKYKKYLSKMFMNPKVKLSKKLFFK